MPASSPLDNTERIRRLEQALDDLRRGRSSSPRLRELADVDLSRVADGEVPVYDAATGRWVPVDVGASRNPFPEFSQSGAVFVDEWGIWQSKVDCTLTEVRFTLTNPSAGADAYVDVIVDGSVIDTVTLGVGVDGQTETYLETIAGDYVGSLTFAVTQAAAGATDLTIIPYGTVP